MHDSQTTTVSNTLFKRRDDESSFDTPKLKPGSTKGGIWCVSEKDPWKVESTGLCHELTSMEELEI